MISLVSVLLVVFFLLASSIKTFAWQRKVFEIQLGFLKAMD